MKSLYDELDDKVRNDPRVTRNSGPRVDIGMLLMGSRDNLRELWLASDRFCRTGDARDLCSLRDAVASLCPLFGERGDG